MSQTMTQEDTPGSIQNDDEAQLVATERIAELRRKLAALNPKSSSAAFFRHQQDRQNRMASIIPLAEADYGAAATSWRGASRS